MYATKVKRFEKTTAVAPTFCKLRVLARKLVQRLMAAATTTTTTASASCSQQKENNNNNNSSISNNNNCNYHNSSTLSSEAEAALIILQNEANERLQQQATTLTELSATTSVLCLKTSAGCFYWDTSKTFAADLELPGAATMRTNSSNASFIDAMTMMTKSATAAPQLH